MDLKVYRAKDSALPEWCIESPQYNRTLHHVAKSTPGMHWDGVAWRGYVDAVATTLLRCREECLYFDKRLIPSPLEEYKTILPVADSKLYDFQKIGVRFLLAKAQGGALLADEMGCGKTPQALRAARALAHRTLVVCPAFVRGVWQKEIRTWWPDVANFVAYPKGVKKPDTSLLTPQTRVVVIHYDILHAWEEALLAWGPVFLILDEAHYLRGAKSKRSVAARNIARTCAWRVGLTGTPEPNRPRDLHNLLDTLSPGRMGNFFHFGLRYCDGHQEEVTQDKIVWNFDGASHTDELRARLKFCMLYRTKKDVGLQLPPKTRQVIEVDVAAKARIPADATLIAHRSNLQAALNIVADGRKVEAFELVESYAVEGTRVVAFTYRRSIAEELVNRLASQGFSVELLHGGVDIAERQARIDRQPQILVATMDSCREGVSLVAWNIGVFVELSYEPYKLLQTEGRLDRHGQELPVTFHYLIGIGTIDELIASAIIAKLDTIRKTIGEPGDLDADLSTGPTGNPLQLLHDALVKKEQEAEK